jgi:lauroyl/myristoyl acyltransferase
MPRVLTLPIIRAVIEGLDFCVPRFRRLALDNMKSAGIPDRDKVWRDLKRFWTRSVHRLVHMRSRACVSQGWRIEGFHFGRQAIASGGPVVLAFFHIGPWEEGLHVLGSIAKPALDLVVRFPFPALERELQWRRDLSGHRFLDWRSGGRELLRHLNAGGTALVAADLFPDSGGFVMHWLGQPAWVSDKAARIAKQTGAVLLPVWTEEGVAHIEEPIDTLDPTAATKQLLQLAERRIREHPHLWIWMHPRFRDKCS